MRIVVTASSRGIGLELVRQLAQRGDVVEATARTPTASAELVELAERSGDRIRLHAVDVASDESVASFAASLKGPIDALVNNAGVYGATDDLRTLEMRDMLDLYSVNALGPLRMIRALLPQLKAGSTKNVLSVSTGMAKLGEECQGGAYGYRMSKVALNMMTRAMAHDLRRDGVLVAVINPGWVQTDMGSRGAPTPVVESASGIVGWLDRMSVDHSGGFLDYRGGTTDW